MEINRRPTLGDARASTRRLAANQNITDVILQGIARRKKAHEGIYQAICLKKSDRDNRERRFVAMTRSSGTNLIPYVVTQVFDEAGLSDEYYSMLSSNILRVGHARDGYVHAFGTGKKVGAITTDIAKARGNLRTLDRYTRKEAGRVVLYGTAAFQTNQPYDHSWRSAHSDLVANCELMFDRTLKPGEIERRAPTRRPFSAKFKAAGAPGVGRVLFNIDGPKEDFAGQPASVSLGKNPIQGDITNVADYLVDVFNPDAVAIRFIPRDYTPTTSQVASIDQMVWNKAAA